MKNLLAALAKVEKKHDGLRGAARALGFDAGYLCRVKSGKTPPGKDLAKALGFAKVFTFVPLKPAVKAQPEKDLHAQHPIPGLE